MTPDEPPTIPPVESDEAIEVVATVHLGSGRDRIRPGEVVMVNPNDPSVAPHLAGGLLVPVRGVE